MSTTSAAQKILIRNKKSFEDSRKKLEIDSIIIQSPLLKIVLAKVLKDYPGNSHKKAGLSVVPYTEPCIILIN